MLAELGKSPWWVKTLLGGVAVIVAVMIVGAIVGDDEEEIEPGDAAEAREDAPTLTADEMAFVASVATQEAESRTATETVVAGLPSPTPRPTSPPVRAWDEGTAVTREAVLDALKDADESARSEDLGKPAGLTVEGDSVTVAYKVESALKETDLLTIAAHTSFSAHRALFANPLLESATIVILADWLDALGNSEEEVTTVSMLSRAGRASGIAWDGLENLVYGDNKHMFCVSDAYEIHLGIYSRLGDTGCLTGARRGM